MPTFPTMSSGSMRVTSSLLGETMAMYPTQISNAFGTKIATFLNDSEQRWTTRPELLKVMLQYHEVNGYDMSLIREFFYAQRGGHVSSDLVSAFDVTLFGVNYQYCVFDQDSLDVQVDTGEKYTFQISIRQLRPN